MTSIDSQKTSVAYFAFFRPSRFLVALKSALRMAIELHQTGMFAPERPRLTDNALRAGIGRRGRRGCLHLVE